MEWVHRYMKWWYDSQKPPRRIEVLDWRPVMMWTWDIAIENCGICRNHIYDLCVECQANQVTAADRYGFKKMSIMGHPYTTWSKFWVFLTPSPLRGHFY